MPIDLDRYYTPERVAINALEQATLPTLPKVCADSTCGSGRLLDAANAVFGPVESIGIDRDREAISQLRLRRPEWQLTVGDLLEKSPLDVARSAIDLLVLNPPFSHGKSKAVDICYGDKAMKGSIAMAHLLKSFEVFQPTLGAIVIVPESLLYSETDYIARQTLEEDYHLQKIADLERCTFHGARVHASVVQITPGKNRTYLKEINPTADIILTNVVRGALSVHLKINDPTGSPFIHSTDIRQIFSNGNTSSLSRTSTTAKGRIKGWVILIPRVGLPAPQIVRAIKLSTITQLSDCVIALEFSNKAAALSAERRIHTHWIEFRGLYRGTGARYVTISRLNAWLPTIAVNPFPQP